MIVPEVGSTWTPIDDWLYGGDPEALQKTVQTGAVVSEAAVPLELRKAKGYGKYWRMAAATAALVTL